MIDALYGRKIELIVGGKQFINELGKEGLTIHFEVPFDDDKEPNVATIKIFNLSDQTIHGINKGAPVILNAGYQNDVGSIFLGFAEKPKTEWQGVDKVTEIKVVDGNESWLRMQIKRTYKEGITGKAILSDLLGLTGLEIGAFKLPVNKVYRGGKAINTLLAKAIAEIAKDCGAKAHVTRGKIFVRPKNEGQVIGFVVDKDHGLIASPTPIETETGDGKKKTKRQGYKVTTLLNHRIYTDAIVQIRSKTANGIFRVEKGRHYGDDRAFYTEMEVYPL